MLFPGTARDLLSKSGRCEGRTLAPHASAGVETTVCDGGVALEEDVDAVRAATAGDRREGV